MLSADEIEAKLAKLPEPEPILTIRVERCDTADGPFYMAVMDGAVEGVLSGTTVAEALWCVAAAYHQSEESVPPDPPPRRISQRKDRG